MAKRRRLDPASFLGHGEPDGAVDDLPDLSRAKGADPMPAVPPMGRPLRARAPIAQVAGGAAASAALDEVAETLRTAREEGRLVLRLPIAAIDAQHMTRDRLAADPGAGDLSRAKGGDEAMEELKASLRARGQQAPVEVVELAPVVGGAARWGLVSGWRRLTALRALHAETGEDRFATALAFVRRPATAAEAYVAMVEENEIREGLSLWERARIVRRAVEVGAFPDETAALRGLFASASYARRSKIKSILPLQATLEGKVRFPEAIGERLGLALAKALGDDPGLASRAEEILGAADPGDAAAEGVLLWRLAEAPAAPPIAPGSFSSLPEGDAADRERRSASPMPLVLRGRVGRAEITGPGVTDDFLGRLERWLRDDPLAHG